ncbi:MAG: tetratricopeptide repeat protein [Syntrophales bacterium]
MIQISPGTPAGTALKRISEAKRSLRQKNIQGCLVSLKEALEVMLSRSIKPAEKKSVEEELKRLLADIQWNPSFKETFGPVEFQGTSDLKVLHSFIKQLISVNVEKIQSSLFAQKIKPDQPVDGVGSDRPAGKSKPDQPPVTAAGPGQPQKEGAGLNAAGDSEQDDYIRVVETIRTMIEKGRYSEARKILEKDERLTDHLVNEFNDRGIVLRKSRDYAAAISEYKRALVVYPGDEGIYYNIARAFYETGDLEKAQTNLEYALRINADFKHAQDFLDYLKLLGRSSNKKKSFMRAVVKGISHAAGRLHLK